jgi:hypothetical protein
LNLAFERELVAGGAQMLNSLISGGAKWPMRVDQAKRDQDQDGGQRKNSNLFCEEGFSVLRLIKLLRSLSFGRHGLCFFLDGKFDFS